MNKIFVERAEAEYRLGICKSCDDYMKKLHMCKVCKCIMPYKVTISDGFCPKNKWNKSLTRLSGKPFSEEELTTIFPKE
jgi:hypothetical protein